MKICPMDKSLILFRCLHFEPLSSSNIEKMGMNGLDISEEQFDRNKNFLSQMIDVYGSCAMLAMDGDYVVGHARFYPQLICDKFQFCCQDPRYGITQDMVETEFSEIENPSDRILRIDCFLVHKDYRGQGIVHLLIDGVLEWAKAHDWKAVRAYASHDNYWFSTQLCAPMLRTYIKHGFRKTETIPFPEVKELLLKIKNGEMGIESKKEFEKFFGGEDLSMLSVLHEVEYRPEGP